VWARWVDVQPAWDPSPVDTAWIAEHRGATDVWR
jgi:hypothetical protein